MKRKVISVYAGIALLWTAAFVTHEAFSNGTLSGKAFNVDVFEFLHRATCFLTDLKFRLRGPIPAANKIAIVEVDSASIAQYGRWPWTRDKIEKLIHRTFEAGAKTVGLDIVFPEPSESMPAEIKQFLVQQGKKKAVDFFDYDRRLEGSIWYHRDRLVMSWMTESPCRPLYSATDQCPVTDPTRLSEFPKDFSKFSIPFHSPVAFDPNSTPLFSVFEPIANIPSFQEAAKLSGFVNADRDRDGLVRRNVLFMMAQGKAHPSLPLAMAQATLQDEPVIRLDSRFRLLEARWKKSRRPISASPLGLVEINFRGAERSFPYVSAETLFAEAPARSLASENPLAALKDATVLIGISALAVGDLAATPFDFRMPGVEVHANILDNLLSGDMLHSPPHAFWFLLLMMTVGAACFGIFAQRLDAYPVLFLSAATLTLLFAIDIFVLFGSHQNWNTIFLYMELFSLTMAVLAAKYIQEERNRKFLRAAFDKYVSPAVVDAIVKDPSQLSIGGRKENLTILFTDIRNFTTLSENMDPKSLSEFLIDYNTLMTEIVFAHEGTLDKYIGDALMCFWGAPLTLRTPAGSASLAAIAMAKRISEVRKAYSDKYGIDIRIGIGIHTGMVTVGNMGSRNHFGYTVIGDAVNLASRLEGITKLFGVSVLTTSHTLDEVKREMAPPPHRYLGSVKAKGKTQSIETVEFLVDPIPTDILEHFQAGLEAFRGRNFADALKHFNKVDQYSLRELKKPDGPSQLYKKECEKFLETPPPADWKPVWTPEK